MPKGLPTAASARTKVEHRSKRPPTKRQSKGPQTASSTSEASRGATRSVRPSLLVGPARADLPAAEASSEQMGARAMVGSDSCLQPLSGNSPKWGGPKAARPFAAAIKSPSTHHPVMRWAFWFPDPFCLACQKLDAQRAEFCLL